MYILQVLKFSAQQTKMRLNIPRVHSILKNIAVQNVNEDKFVSIVDCTLFLTEL